MQAMAYHRLANNNNWRNSPDAKLFQPKTEDTEILFFVKSLVP